MVSREQRQVITLAMLALPALAQQNSKTFYPDDPLWREPAPRPVKQVEKREVDDLYEFLLNSFVLPHREEKIARHKAIKALNANTIGEVPDSAWYTNRQRDCRMTIEELKRGPGDGTPPGPGSWHVIAAKSDGVTPGFVIEDERKNRYVLKFDPPDFPELSSAADVIGSKFFYALGYNTPENYIVHFSLENIKIPEGVMYRGADGKKRPLTARVLDEMLKPQPKGPDGKYRALASRFIAGKLAGPFSYQGMRTDDPNDTVPHEDRRELRGLAVFAAWLNHHDTRSINSMDSLVTENGASYVKHYLLDFGSTLGSNGAGPKHPWSGHQYTIDNKAAAIQMATFGFYLPRWERASYPKYTGVGLFDYSSFDPLCWKPNYPNAAFLLMDNEDAFWAAKQVAAFSDTEIRALVETGEYSDPRAVDWITECLIKRRDKIAEAWFSKVLPLDRFRISDGKLVFEDLGAARGIGKTREYSVRWASRDKNATGSALPDNGAKVPTFAGDTKYLAATIACASADVACGNPITVYVRQCDSDLEVVGLDR
jgi:hypothetical protein